MISEHDLLEQRIEEWKSFLRKRQALRDQDVDELEDHLRSQTDALKKAGLSQDEAFLVALKRMGDLDAISREFAHEYSERLWKQLVVASGASSTSTSSRGEILLAVTLAVAAAVALKIPELFGVHLDGTAGEMMFYARNASLFVLPFLVAFFASKRGILRATWPWLTLPFLAGAALVNLPNFQEGGQTEILSAIHLPIALWLVAGISYAGKRWRDHEQRMNFVRFSGEWFIYYTLIALGGGILIAFTAFIFESIGVEVGPTIAQWLLPCGAAGAIIISAWLVEAKQSVIENMAPVLTMLFTPLFTILLLVFMVTMFWTGNAIDVEREMLIGFDLLLILVMCLLLYAISARERQSGPSRFDKIRFLLVISALVVDALALWAMAVRISEFGFSPNKTAALGLNILLLVNLGGSAVLYAKFLAGRSTFARLEQWQTAYLPVFAAWAWAVVAFFPPIFHFQ